MMVPTAQSIRVKLQNNLLRDNKFIDEKLNLENLLMDKNAILMETRRFTQSSLNAKQCCETLVKISYLLLRGEMLTPHESSEVFFSITRLFQSGDQRLRRLVYLVVKSLEVKDSEVFILTSSLTKDMNTGNDCYRANALRAFSKIADPTMAAQIERYLKTAVVDRNPFVSSSALLCGIHLWRIAHDVVKRWVNEVTECINSKYPMVQFHAMALLYELKKTDRLALQKIVTSITKKEGSSKSPLTECLVMRYSVKIISQEPDIPTQKALLTNLEKCLGYSNEMLRLEAAKSFTSLVLHFNKDQEDPTILGFDLLPAIITLRDFLSSPKPVIRYAAIRQINLLSQCSPSLLSQCNSDVEHLLSDPNRNIASLALTTLLKIGNEGNIEHLIKQITSFMSDGSESLKQDVLKAVKMLCLSYPSKHRLLMSVLATSLKEEGNFEFKSEAVKAIITLINKIPDALETGLNHLCDFIEDCEFPSLCMLILTFLGERVPTTGFPSKYIRFIYNRLILESAHLRASGVDSLTKISIKCPELRKDILLLLESCSTDNDDEVRDRTNLYLKAIQISLISNQEIEDKKKLLVSNIENISSSPSLDLCLSSENEFDLDSFCEKLSDHIKSNNQNTFDSTIVPKEVESIRKTTEVESNVLTGSIPLEPAHQLSTNNQSYISANQLSHHSQQLDSNLDTSQYIIDQVSNLINPSTLGKLLCSSRLESLTEKEAELVVFAQKHFFQNNIILELTVNNTLQNELLYNVEPILTIYNYQYWDIKGYIPISKLEFEKPQSCFILLQPSISLFQKLTTESFNLYMKYHISESLIGATEEYSVEPINISVSDYLCPHHLRTGQFKLHWERLNNAYEQVGKYSLNFRSLIDAVNGLISSLNISACDKSDVVETHNTSHTLLLSGLYLKEIEILCVAVLFMDPEHGCILKFTCRCMNDSVCSAVIESFE